MRHVVAAAVMARLGSPETHQLHPTRRARPVASRPGKARRRAAWSLLASALWKSAHPGG